MTLSAHESAPAASAVDPSLPSEPPAADRSTEWAISLLLVACIVAAMLPLLDAEFTKWDDDVVLTANPLLNPPSLAGTLWYWKNAFCLYIPVTYTVWALVAAVAWSDQPHAHGVMLDPMVFHAFNLLMHALCAIVAYRILRLWIKRPWAAGAGALVFAIHPVQVEAVGWVSGLKDVLAGLVMLLALWQYLVYARADANQSGSPPRWRLVAATLLFVVAMLCKPSAMMFPLLAGWIDWWMIGRPWKRVAPMIVVWLFLSLACGRIAQLAQPTWVNAYIPLIVRPWFAADSLAFYIGKILWPINLCVHYDRPAASMLERPQIFVTWIIPFAIALALYIGRSHGRAYIAAAGVFVLGMLPTLNLVPYSFQGWSITADHYLYVPMFGVAIAIAWALSADWIHRRRTLVTAIILCIVLLLGVATFRQARTWHDTSTVFEHVLSINPHSTAAHNNIAAVMLEARKYEEAADHSRTSLQIDPYGPMAVNNMAFALDGLKRPREASRMYQMAIFLNPDSIEPLIGFAGLLCGENQYASAVPLYERAVSINPTFPNLQKSLAHARAGERHTGAATTRRRIGS